VSWSPNFHSNGGPFTFTAKIIRSLSMPFTDRADRANKIVILTGAGGGSFPKSIFHPSATSPIPAFGPGSRRRRSASRKHSNITRAVIAAYRGSRSCDSEMRYWECDGGGRVRPLQMSRTSRRHCARRRNLYCVELSRRSGDERGVPASTHSR